MSRASTLGQSMGDQVNPFGSLPSEQKDQISRQEQLRMSSRQRRETEDTHMLNSDEKSD
jgi:hypothetical protein